MSDVPATQLDAIPAGEAMVQFAAQQTGSLDAVETFARTSSGSS